MAGADGNSGQPMSVISVNVGQPREVEWEGRTVLTSIFKHPVAGRIPLQPHNLQGDQQSDLTVHGGPEKAVYAYTTSAYEAWREELPDTDLTWGNFGENLTIAGIDDHDVCIGDRFQIGTAEVIVTQPRIPCYKLGIRFGRQSFLKQFLRSGRPGFYLAIVQPGEIGAGDPVTRLSREEHGVSVVDIVRLYTHDRYDEASLRRALTSKALAAVWRELLQEQLTRIAPADAPNVSTI